MDLRNLVALRGWDSCNISVDCICPMFFFNEFTYYIIMFTLFILLNLLPSSKLADFVAMV